MTQGSVTPNCGSNLIKSSRPECDLIGQLKGGTGHSDLGREEGGVGWGGRHMSRH